MNKRPVVNFYYIPGANQEDFESLMSCILLHEVAHSFGLDDVYDTDWHDGEDGIQCVMERSDENDYEVFYENTKNGSTSPFCDYCEERLRTLVANKYFEGK